MSLLKEESTAQLICKNLCTGCAACAAICPCNAIRVVLQNGFYYPVIDTDSCVNCGLCTKTCKVANNIQKNDAGTFWAVVNRDEMSRQASTSGGAFYLFAKAYIDSGGIVYGAAFMEDWQVSHIRCADKTDLKRIQKSKYVQSNILNVYRRIENDLLSGKEVLFSGTACQCSGIKSYLVNKNIDTQNLLLIDLICHGVPSPEIWRKYLKKRMKEKKNIISNIDFRDKKKSWRDFHLMIKYKNGLESYYRQNEDYFLVLFFHNLILRESCYQCKYACPERISDVTIGDYWGVWEFNPELDDDRGISVVMLNTEKGKKIWERCKGDSKIVELSKESVIKHQNNLRHPSMKDQRYDLFWSDYQKKGFEYILKKYADATFWGKIKRKYLYKLLYDLGLWNLIMQLRK